MLNPVPSARTCASAWIAAAQVLVKVGDDAHNLIVDIDDPITHTETDTTIILGLDRFLRDRRAYPIATVANTIFPQDLYRRYGPDAFVTEYLRSYEAIRKKGWGRYFERMVRWPGDDEKRTDQLHFLIDRIKKQLGARQTYRNVYEMTLFDPVRDGARNLNRQCLSFLSFKLHPERGLMLTAMYRNHYYIARALGNFIGLGNLMAYIAKRAGTTVGPLTCVSTHAEIDSASCHADKDGIGDACRGWTLTEARQLVQTLATPASSGSAEPSPVAAATD